MNLEIFRMWDIYKANDLVSSTNKQSKMKYIKREKKTMDIKSHREQTD